MTDVGRVRDGNEDSFLVDEALSLFVVADGMGGHAAGEVASGMAVHAFRETIAAASAELRGFECGIGASREDILRLMEQGVQAACGAVFQEAQDNPERRGMGTTLIALLVIGSRGFIAHVGDSRVYMVREDTVHQLTEDHSLINELLKRGRLAPEQIEKLNMKNAVTRAVGVYASVEADTLDFDVLPGDRFLLCSDGLTEYVESADILKVFREVPVDGVAQRFVDHANGAGGKDNITAVVVKVPRAEDGLDKLANEVNLKLETLHGMPLFRHLTYQELVRVMNIIGVREFVADERVIEEGADGDEMFIVLTGKVQVHSGGTGIVELGPGEHFGEMALIDRAPRNASVSSCGDTQLMSIRRRDFFDTLRKDHDVAVKLLWSFLGVLTDRLRSTSSSLNDVQEQLSVVQAEALVSGGDLEEVD